MGKQALMISRFFTMEKVMSKSKKVHWLLAFRSSRQRITTMILQLEPNG